MDADKITELLVAAMPEAQIEVRGDDGHHFEAVVVSDRFAGMRTLARHRTVYDALGSLVGNEIHALSLRTLTPEEAA